MSLIIGDLGDCRKPAGSKVVQGCLKPFVAGSMAADADAARVDGAEAVVPAADGEDAVVDFHEAMGMREGAWKSVSSMLTCLFFRKHCSNTVQIDSNRTHVT